jgi:hypothetical protein
LGDKNKMKKIFFIILSLALLSFNESQSQKHLYEDDFIKCSYETSQGRISGQYISYYKTGQKKSEGKFENNYRIGKWTVWDSTGRIRMQREYSDPFTFKRLIPEIPKEKTIELLNTTRYSIKNNQDGFIEYFYLKERMVEWSKKIWRTVSPKENPVLFDNNKLFDILNKNILSKNITAYSTKDDKFTKEFSFNTDISSIKLICFKIKEDCFFDNERLVSESRIIGLCPIAVNTVTRDTVDLYWVYFPQIRKYLAQEKIQQTGLPTKIRTFDDLFFYRYFCGQIYKESNVYDRPIATYTTGKEIDKEAERIELSLIESEHDIWIRFTK